MFVRWKKRACKKSGRGNTYSAYLVQSHRIDGKPRQEVIAFLGNLPTYNWQPHMNDRGRDSFLKCAMSKATNRLQYLKQSESHRTKLYETLEQKVSHIIAEEEKNFREIRRKA